MDELPHDVVEIIGNHLCTRNLYRDAYNIACDAAALFTSSKSSFTRSLAKYILHKGVGASVKAIGGYDVVEVPTNSVCKLKQVCRKMYLPVTGTKNALIERLHEKMRASNRLLNDESLIQKLLSVKNRTVSSYMCRETYGLNDQDMTLLVRIGNVYRLKDVRQVSLNKHKNLEGLVAFKKQREAQRKLRNALRIEKYESLRAELKDALNAVDCADLLETTSVCLEYIKSGRGNSQQIASDLADIKFLRSHTLYDVMYEDIVRQEASYDVKNDDAFEYVRRLALRDWGIAFQNRNEALQDERLTPGIRKILMGFPRYYFRASDYLTSSVAI